MRKQYPGSAFYFSPSVTFGVSAQYNRYRPVRRNPSMADKERRIWRIRGITREIPARTSPAAVINLTISVKIS